MFFWMLIRTIQKKNITIDAKKGNSQFTKKETPKWILSVFATHTYTR